MRKNQMYYMKGYRILIISIKSNDREPDCTISLNENDATQVSER